MKNKINLYWYRHNEGHGNFGDELNPYIINRICNVEINYVNLEYLRSDKFLALKILVYSLIRGKIKLNSFINYIYMNFSSKSELFLAIGSILQFCKTDKVTVWGSGMIASDSVLPNAKYLAVRGYKTVNRILELGFKPPKYVGDPALLLPLIYISKKSKKYRVGIIPHHIHYDAYVGQFQENILVINLLDKIEHIIDQINQCELTISTSLHGIIVSHAYGVKSIWARENNKKLAGDDIKFPDYFTSVDLNEYSPIDIEKYTAMDSENIYFEIDSEYKNVLLPNKQKLEQIQNNLLEVFPYKKAF
ncbi:polysaccharide pyruvyl transferase family protein [Aequorivita sinensis]|uniref:polysaccharide pyruvyl transferase family protein n=1 Tax=Aequorivita sinensis TaxID=1382458 RepID=UPI0023017E81|nr:polysaccharide pyruvyl transferase family protein [Aequorivita sinensis]